MSFQEISRIFRLGFDQAALEDGASAGQVPRLGADGQMEFVDAGGGQQSLETATVTLTSGQILAMHDTPVVVVAAPGENKLLVPVMAYAFLRFGTTPYVAPAKICIDYPGDIGKSGGIPLQLQDTGGSGILEETADAVSLADHESAWNMEAADAVNAPLVVYMSSNPTGGDGTFTVGVSYTVATFA